MDVKPFGNLTEMNDEGRKPGMRIPSELREHDSAEQFVLYVATPITVNKSFKEK